MNEKLLHILNDPLIVWLNTFKLQRDHAINSYREISTGQALAEVLTQIAPEWFTSAWSSTIKSSSLPECLKPDAQMIGENCDKKELKKLMQLILFCAINCNDKEYFINVIMGLEEYVQEVIMKCILEIEDSIENFNKMNKSEESQLSKSGPPTEFRDKMSHELQQNLLFLQEKNNALEKENENLQQKLERFENQHSCSKFSLNHKYSECLRIDFLENQLSELKMKEVSLVSTANEAYKICRESVETVEKFEATIEEFKIKLDIKMKDLKRHLEILRNKNNEVLEKVENIDFL